MLIPPKYILTPGISELLQKIEGAKSVIDTIPIPPEIESNLRRQSILRSSLFSARIEGNPLTLEEVINRPSNDQKKREIYNILGALQLVNQRRGRDLSLRFILDLHKGVLNGLVTKPELGKLISEVSAIFNSSGIAVYLPPPPRQIPALLTRFISFSNSAKEGFVPIRAALSHYLFEKIHPFLDGNGRVGRLVFQSILFKGDYGMKGLVSVEEYLDERRLEYYRSLDESERDVTGYLEFMLEALCESSQKAKALVLAKQKLSVEDYLLPRRAEIFHIIKDHELMNFDMLKRRFMAVNQRTLRYDLKKLKDAGLIRKRGTTNGAYYEIVDARR